MLYLLRIKHELGCKPLPIAELTATRLEHVLLEPNGEGRVTGLTTAIVDDPFFSIWVACTIPVEESAAAHTAAACARWLEPRLAERLAADLVPSVSLVAEEDSLRYANVAASLVFRPDDHADGLAADVQFWQRIQQATAALLSVCPDDAYVGGRLLPTFRPSSPPLLATLARRVATDEATPRQAHAARLLENAPGIGNRLPALISRLAVADRSREASGWQLERAKLAALKELAYGASHEINNPLANIAARAQTLLRDEHDPQRRGKLSAIFDQAMRAHEMIADLMLYAHPPALVPSPCKLAALAREAISSLADEAQRRNVELQLTSGDADADLVADETQLAVAIGAVVKNALEAVADGGRVQLSVEADTDVASLVVRDDGPGIPDEVRVHIFDPFYSGREAGRGLGFGLSKCWRIVTDHGGRLHVRSGEPRGAEFSIELPLSRAA